MEFSQVRSNQQASTSWHPDRRFWLYHLVIPALMSSIVLFAMELTGFDVWLADRWYAFEGDQWALRDHWLTYDVIHHHGKQAIIALWLLGLSALVMSGRIARLKTWRWPLAYLLTAMVAIPALITRFKHYSPVPCPWDLMRYGGDTLYQHTLSYEFGSAASGHCFPAGHASGGFALLAIYFSAYLYVRRPAIFLLPGMIVGSIFGFGQQARGAHFISHDLWTLSLCWFGALGLFLLFRPQRWKGTGPAVSKEAA